MRPALPCSTRPALALALAVLALALAAGLGWAAAPRPIREEPRLAVNTAMTHRQLVPADQVQGEAQLALLVAEAEFEEVWAFLPEKGEWVEVGCCERRTPMGNYVGVEAYVLEIMKQNRALAVYHIHHHTRFQKDNFNAEKRRQKVLEEALPSPDDMEAMLKLTRFFRTAQPEGSLAWRIVSRHGVTEYGLTGPAAPLPEEPDLKPFAFSRISHEELAETPEGREADRALIARACNELSRPPFRVAFSPR